MLSHDQKSSKSKGKKKKKRRGKRRLTGPPRRRPRAHCICAACGVRVPLYTEVPCYVMTCPRCGMSMVKEGTHKVLIDLEDQPPDH